MLDEETAKEVHEALEAAQPEIRQMGATLVETLFKAAEQTLAEHKLDPLTKREKIILIGVAAAITMHTLTASLGTAISLGAKP
jgi:hypothetical protein